MQHPVNFDSICLDGILNDWLSSLRDYAVEALLVLGPDPFAGQEKRLVLALHPPRLLEAANALAGSQDFGAPWRLGRTFRARRSATWRAGADCGWRMDFKAWCASPFR